MKKLTSAFICLLLAIPCWARIITVDDNGPADFNNVQAAINDSNDSDTIIVAAGTYTGPGNRDIDFLGKAITVKSESGAESCVINCSGRETDKHRGFYFHNGEDANSVLDGFTINNGYHSAGGGIYCESSSPTITDCTITNNSAEQGGGICNLYSSPTVTNCTFSGNSAWFGGGMQNYIYSSPTLINCTFSGNSADNGGGMQNYVYSRPTLTNCILWGNAAEMDGNQIALYSTDYPSILTISYSDVQGGLAAVYIEPNCSVIWESGNIEADPNFTFPTDCHLMAGSPCIDAGTNDPNGGLPATDFDGNPRPLDGDGDGDAVADIGAFEFNDQLPSIALSTKEIQFFMQEGGPEPNDQVLSIRNCGGGTLVWTVSQDCNWVEAIPATGVSQGDANNVVLKVNGAGLTHGIFNCLLTISDPSAVNSPRTVSVTLYVNTTLHVPANYDTIQAAIDAALDGDTVQVAAGTYYENVNVNKRIELIGVDMPVVDAGGRGVSTILVSADGCTIRGFKVIGSSGSGGWYEKDAGIKVQSSNNVIENNIASDNDRGISLYHSSNNILKANETINNNSDGIYIYYSRNNILRENCMSNNPCNFGVWTWTELSDFKQDIDTSNTVDGKPIYYIVDANNVVIDDSTNAGCVVVVNSTNIVVRDLSLRSNLFGVLFAYTQASRIENLTTVDNGGGGIWMQYSSNNALIGNNVSNSYHGICLWDSGNNTLRANNISNCTCNFGYWSGSELSHFRQDIDTSNTVDGKPICYLVDESNRVIDSSSNAGYVGVVNSTNIVVKDLTLEKNEQGVLFAWTENSRIENIADSNNADGIWLQHSSNDTLINNIVSNNFEDYSICLQESNNTTIVNNTISGNNGYGIYSYFSSPTIVNNIIVANESYGIVSYLSSPTISYNDVWDNYLGNYVGCSAGLGDISIDPLFVNAADGDYHLKSEGWRWDSDANQWTWDDVTSRCIDAGNPGCPLGDESSEPSNVRINMGAYGGTVEASMPPHGWALLADITNDGTVNLQDYAFQAADWLNPAEHQPGDLNRNGMVAPADLALLADDWLKQTSWWRIMIPCLREWHSQEAVACQRD